MTGGAKQPILLAGIPRSGSSWVGGVLSQAPGLAYCFEPDNEKTSVLAYALKQGLHRFPYFSDNTHHSRYLELWRLAFEGRRGRLERLLKPLKRRLMASPQVLEAEVGEKCGLMHTSFFRYTNGTCSKRRSMSGFTAPLAAKLIAPGLRVSRFLGAANARVLGKSVHCILALPWLDRSFSPRVVVLFRNPLT
jgi:hypothetical protein